MPILRKGKTLLKLRYFSADLALAAFEDRRDERCSLCGKGSRLLEEYDSTWTGAGGVRVRPGSPPKGLACLTCVRSGALEHFHRVERASMKAPAAAVKELRRTPPF